MADMKLLQGSSTGASEFSVSGMFHKYYTTDETPSKPLLDINVQLSAPQSLKLYDPILSDSRN